MLTSRLASPVLLPLVGIILLALPGRVLAQCNVGYTGMNTYASTIVVYKTLTMITNCATTMMNALACFPGSAPAAANILSASANTATANPSCAWSCGCGTVTISGADGLPVELMEFSVDGEAVLESSPKSGSEQEK